MKIRPNKGLTFDDVLLIPKRSSVISRQEVDTSARLVGDIRLKLPVVSANMDTVTEAIMAIAMARAGGIGIIHRFMSPETQAEQVRLVKRTYGYMIEKPYAISPEASIEQAEAAMRRWQVSGLVVVDAEGRLLGLLTRRDLGISPKNSVEVRQAMTPRERLVTAGQHITPVQARQLMYENRVEKLPVIDEADHLLGLITMRDLTKFERYPLATVDGKDRLRVGAAVGVTENEMKRAEALLAAGADLLVIDIAHGHAEHCLRMVKKLKTAFPQALVMAGNVATAEGARDLAQAGADAIKVGIGPGSICTTRIVTGFGVPQLTAIMDSRAGLVQGGFDLPIIADGGIRNSGDMVKALASGADVVMIGSLFAGCDEAPGTPVIRDGRKVKVVRGMASLGAAMGRRQVERGEDESAEDPEDWSKVVPEGVEAVVPYRGQVSEILYQLVGGLRSALSYGGARNIKELQDNAEFVEITPAGMSESRSHDVDRV
jgi:IMP dehydrogenase